MSEYRYHATKGEENALMHLHDVSMGSNKIAASSARMLKQIHPVAMKALDDELGREDPDIFEQRSVLMLAAVATVRNLLNNMLINIVPAEFVVSHYEKLADQLASDLKRDAEQIGKCIENGELT